MGQNIAPKGKRGRSNSGGDSSRLDAKRTTNSFPQEHMKGESAGKRSQSGSEETKGLRPTAYRELPTPRSDPAIAGLVTRQGT